MPADTSTVSWLFPWNGLAEICKSDSRIRFFVDRDSPRGQNVRQLVDWKEVLAESNQDRAFKDATALESYASFAGLAHSNVRAANEMDDLTARLNWATIRKFLTTKSVMFLLAVLLILLLALPEHAAFAGMIAAVAIAPMPDLAWREARMRRNIAYFILASVLGGLGVALLSVPLALGFGYPYLSWLFLFAFLGVAWVFGLDHTRRPLIRDLNMEDY